MLEDKIKNIINSLISLESFVISKNLKGVDPYDALNSKRFSKFDNKYLRLLLTNFFRRSPFDFRSFFGIRDSINPKALGLFLTSYSNFDKLPVNFNSNNKWEILNLIKKYSNTNFPGNSWGYNFPWQNRFRLLPKNTPTAVNTAFVGHGLLDLYDSTMNTEALEMANGAGLFLSESLNQTSFEDTICFSYTPFEKNLVHNANMLVSSLLARLYSINNNSIFRSLTLKSLKFTLKDQRSNGLWPYSIYEKTDIRRYQTDWHQGFILDSLIMIYEYMDLDKDMKKQVEKAIVLGGNFYNKQFDNRGRGFWRYPQFYPVNIHNQSQGITTFSKLEKFIPGSLQKSFSIVEWTINNMQDQNGSFYYEQGHLYTNKIPYMRWNQAWMLYALSFFLLNYFKHEKKIKR